MQYRVQYLDGLNNVLCERAADVNDEVNVFELVSKDWLPHTVRVRVLDPYNFVVLSVPAQSRPTANSSANDVVNMHERLAG